HPRRLPRVGPVHGVFLDVGTELSADRPFRGPGRVGRPHQIAPAGDGLLALEHGDEDRTRAHEANQIGEELPLAMHGVEALGVAGGERDDARDDGHQPPFLDHREDAAEDALPHRVRLDDTQRLLLHDSSLTSRNTACMVAPSSAGLGAMRTPAARNASIFSAAVPRPPAMIAPAWPIRFPLGAVCPAMKATTGFRTWALMKLAASSSAVPPISPIRMMASVAGSSLNSRSASTKPVPMIGSPPMPMQVDCPMPSSVSWWTVS